MRNVLNDKEEQMRLSEREENTSHFIKEMKSRLDVYKAEVNEFINTKKPIESEYFKKNFYSALENLMNQVSFVKDKKLKEQKIENIYKWFKVKLKYFNDLNSITARTDKYYFENHPDIEEYKKSNYYEAGNYPLYYEREHRTEEPGFLPPKDRYLLLYIY
jgi:hypothetical protein